MTTRVVKTQAELDAALADPDATTIDIRSDRGVWLMLRDSRSKTVEASGSATVEASDSATVRAGSHTAVHLHSGGATVRGGVLIDHTAVDLTAARAWVDYHGVDTVAEVEAEYAVVYKAVREDMRSSHGFAYPLAATVACDDFADTDECGAGLHFSPSPAQAATYDSEATRYLECHVRIDELRPITDGGTAKAKAPRATVVREVDVHARPQGMTLAGSPNGDPR